MVECGTLGKPSSDNRTRVYTKAECDQLKGDYHSTGECTAKTGGSFSAECSYLNYQQPLLAAEPTNSDNKMSTEMIGIIVGGVIGGLILIAIVTLIYSNYSTKQYGGGKRKTSPLLMLGLGVIAIMIFLKGRLF